MSWEISNRVADILQKGRDFAGIEEAEAEFLLHLDPGSREIYAVMETADAMSRRQFAGKGERHFHIGINIEPCPFNCAFCSLTEDAGIFVKKISFSEDDIIGWAEDAEAEHADALNIMTTGTYSFDRLLDTGRLLRRKTSVPLVANTRDISRREAEQLLDAGFVGAYHALRLGEGQDTPFRRERRMETIRNITDAGLRWMNCVEPVGPEHGKKDIARLMVMARTMGATYSGVMRRINFPGSPFEPFGMITEREMARMVAVSRLVMGDTPKAHCIHEPNTLSLIAGGNLLFPEVGASPRDREADTEKGRGRSIAHCGTLLRETDWDPDLPSNCFALHSGPDGHARHGHVP